MTQYIIRRLLMMVPVLFGVSVIVFAIMRIAPGDVATMILMGSGGEGGASAEAIAKLREQLGLNKPYHVQYVEFMAGLLRLDPGNSLWSGQPIRQELGQRLPITMEIALLAIVISWAIAIPTGILSAIRQDTWVDWVSRVLSITGLAVPVFWMGTLVIMGLTYCCRWIPPLGYTDPLRDPWRHFQQIVWPTLVLGFFLSAVVSRMTRSAMLEVLREDYIRTAWAKGLRERVIVVRHAIKNALLPVITLSSIQLGNLMGGAVITETIFTIPGVGRYLVDAIFHRDYPVVQTIVIMLAVIFVFLNLVVDLIYGWLDPRIRYT